MDDIVLQSETILQDEIWWWITIGGCAEVDNIGLQFATILAKEDKYTMYENHFEHVPIELKDWSFKLTPT